MDLTYYKTFLEVAKWKNFTRAADVLGYAQSSVTVQIRKLEAAYGITLFERIGKQIALTPAGEELHRYAEQLVRLYEESRVRLSQPITETITIGTYERTIASILLPDILGACKQEFPHVHIVYQEVALNELLRALKANECDVGFLVHRKQTHPDFVFEVVREEEYVLIANPNHPLTRLPLVHPSELSDHDLYMTVPGCLCRELLENMLQEHGVPCQPAMEIYSYGALKTCVMNSMGVALIPRTIVQHEWETGQLAILPLAHPKLRLFMQWVYHRQKPISPPMRHVMELLKRSERRVESSA